MAIFCLHFFPSLITICSLTLEITTGVSATFETIWQKSAYLTNYVSKYWTELHQHFKFGRHMYRDYKTDINFAVA